MTAEPRETPFDRGALKFSPLAERRNRVSIERDRIDPAAAVTGLSADAERAIATLAERIRSAKERGAARMLTFGAHTIKNGLSPVLIRLIESGAFNHLATNGAGIIHDWEIAFCGETSEDVRENLATGTFGAWEETCRWLNLALAVGAYDGLGYGASVGRMVAEERLRVPTGTALLESSSRELAANADRAAAAADLLHVIRRNGISGGELTVPHRFKQYGLQAAAWRLGVPFTGHPMFGHDIIYEHPANSGAAVGRTAERDFLAFVKSVENLSAGVYVSVGSAIMSPMVFEKSLSMARNAAHQRGERIEDFLIVVVDLAPAAWDWAKGEPPPTKPDYYLRFNKTFSRTGGRVQYVAADNRQFLPALPQAL